MCTGRPGSGAACHHAGVSDLSSDAAAAAEDFYRARRRAALRRFLAQMGGHDDRAVPYDEVRRRLRAVESAERTLEDVALDAIVGSVGRAADFTRGFLPLRDEDQERWTRVRRAMTGLEGVPPVELYRIGDAYFVKDGNHRVSVARQLGMRTVQAYVTPVRTRVPYAPGDDPSDLIVRSEQAAFLERTGLDRERPGAERTVRVTEPGGYATLLEHIGVHRWYMGIDEDRPVPMPEAAGHWFDDVYAPVVRAIVESGVLRGFPGRTEADLYLWLAEHRAELAERIGWDLPSETLAMGVAGEPFADRERRDAWLERVAHDERGAHDRRLADDVLAVLDLDGDERPVTAQALRLAAHEGARLYGLAVRTAPVAGPVHDAEGDAQGAQRDRFLEACAAAGLSAQWAAADGDPAQAVLERARWVDVVVADLRTKGGTGAERSEEQRTEEGPVAPWARSLVRRAPRPLLTVGDGPASELARPLLAFDGSERSETGLFAVAYAALRWGARPTVLHVVEGSRPPVRDPLERARAAFARFGVEADLIRRHGPVAETIAAVAERSGADLVVIGSHKRARWFEEVFGGTLEPVLLRSRGPVLIV